MVGYVIHPLNTMFFGRGVYEAVAKMSPFVQLHSFRSVMSPQDLFFKANDAIPGSDMGHRVGFQPSGGGLHHCEHLALALVGLWQCDIVNLPSQPIFMF